MQYPTFLLVDDIDVVRAILRRALIHVQPDAVVTEAETVAEAIKAIKRTRFTAVITDYHLPDGTGLDVLAVLQGQHPDVPVVVASGDADVEPTVVAAGAIAFMRKPLDTKVFIQAMRRVVQ